MAAKEDIWALAQSTLQELLQEGGVAASQALELTQALEESKELGDITTRLVLIHGTILCSRAQAQIAAILEGSAPAQPCKQRFLN